MIVFVSAEETEALETEELEQSGPEEKVPQAYDRYVKEKLQDTEYLGIVIGLRRLRTSVGRIRDSWQGESRSQTLCELDNLLLRQQELELKIERIEDVFVREYAYGQLDRAAAERRHLSEEVRWDIMSGRCLTI